jgi:hypothetical protein
MSTSTDPPTSPPRPSTTGNSFAIILVSIAALIGLAMTVGGLGLVGAHLFLRDDGGYFTTETKRLASKSYAVTSDAIDLGQESVGFDAGDLDASLEIVATTATPRPIFVGIGPTLDVAHYLRGAGYSQVRDFGDNRLRYTQVRGNRRPAAPSRQPFWDVQTTGAGEQRLEWDVDAGNWTAVVMNADGARGVVVDAEAGVKIGWLIWVGVGLTVIGLVIMSASIYGTSELVKRRRRDAQAPPPSQTTEP